MMQLSRKVLIVLALLVVLALMVGLFSPYLGARKIIRPDPGTKLTVPAFAYAPSPYQTDSTPCLTASGARVRRGTVAANFLPLGTILKINNEHFIVEDRMHPRYNQAIDILKPTTAEARQFGRQTVEITIVSYGKPGQALPAPTPVEVAKPPATKPAPQKLGSVSDSDTIEPPSFVERWQGGVQYLQRLLRAGAPADVNRYDVKCF